MYNQWDSVRLDGWTLHTDMKGVRINNNRADNHKEKINSTPWRNYHNYVPDVPLSIIESAADWDECVLKVSQ